MPVAKLSSDFKSDAGTSASDHSDSQLLQERKRLEHSSNNGEFWKNCPGTAAGYYCCGYQIITPLTGCGMYCNYCVLQVYFQQQHQVVYTNFSDLVAEVHSKMPLWKNRVIRFGTGEFADSLFQEPHLHLSEKIASLLAPYPNVLVEFKTKSNNATSVEAIKNPHKVVMGFSLSTPRNISLFEKDTASLEERLQAARWCEDKGFWVAFHFDPMIWYPQWEADYRQLVDRVFSTLKDPSRIAWWSMGGFRTTPILKRHLEASNRHLPLFCGEMVLGEDHKLRYFRPIRIDFYRVVQEQVAKHYPQTTLYLCMENREVWDDAGMLYRIPKGLTSYLDARAHQMLNLN